MASATVSVMYGLHPSTRLPARSHAIFEPVPGYPPRFAGVLREGHPVEGEHGFAWIVRDELGRIFGGQTAAEALEAFHRDRKYPTVIDMRADAHG